MQLIYNVEDKPKFGKLIAFSFQQLLAIITATIVVPVIINSALGYQVLDSAAALVGAGFGTIVYLLFTKFKSPVFLGSSFAFIGPLIGAGAFGYFGLLIGGAFAAGVYIVIAIIVRFAGSNWVNKLMPPVVIGPTVALIGLSLAGNAMGDLTKASGAVEGIKVLELIEGTDLYHYVDGFQTMSYNLVAILCGLFTFFIIVYCSVKGNKTMKLIPFIIGILAGYALAGFFSIFGYACEVEYLKIIDFSALVNNFQNVNIQSFFDYPKFTFLFSQASADGHVFSQIDGMAVANIALLYIPVAFVVFAEHIADHKNISSIIERDLLTNPGLHRTLLGDGVGSLVGVAFGGCPNTTYGESIGCVAITKNASVVSILGAAVLAIVISFFSPIIAFINTIPSCVMGGVCLSLYGFIAVSGLNMLRNVDLGESKNLFVVSSILIAGIGGLSLQFGLATKGSAVITISSIATALIIGIVVNACFKAKESKSGDSLASANAAAAVSVAESETNGDILNEEEVKPTVEKDEIVETAKVAKANADEVTADAEKPAPKKASAKKKAEPKKDGEKA